MKLTLLLLLISISAFAQQNDKPFKYTDKIDSLDLEFDWKKELFRQWDCYCPWLTTDVVQSMPRELHPYKWINENKPIIVDDSTFQQLIKSDLAFKRMYQRADSISNGHR